MQDIAIRIAAYVQTLAVTLRDDEEGQTAVEYAGILAVIALIFVALFKMNLGGEVTNAISAALKDIFHTG